MAMRFGNFVRDQIKLGIDANRTSGAFIRLSPNSTLQIGYPLRAATLAILLAEYSENLGFYRLSLCTYRPGASTPIHETTYVCNTQLGDPVFIQEPGSSRQTRTATRRRPGPCSGQALAAALQRQPYQRQTTTGRGSRRLLLGTEEYADLGCFLTGGW